MHWIERARSDLHAFLTKRFAIRFPVDMSQVDAETSEQYIAEHDTSNVEIATAALKGIAPKSPKEAHQQVLDS